MVSPLCKKRVYVDSSIFIYAIETPLAYPLLRTKFLDLFLRGELTLVTSWITFAELLANPLRAGDTHLEAGYRNLFVQSLTFKILPVNQDISEVAANIRASKNLKLPDSLHIATGIISGCTHYLTGDVRWSNAVSAVVTSNRL